MNYKKNDEKEKKELHNSATTFFGMIVTDNITGISGESLKISASIEF